MISPLRAAAPEVLAPAGDWDCLRAAVENGADAVYFGLQGHNARARAANFQTDELDAIFRLLHGRGVKGYVAVNTLVFSSELPAVEELLRRIAAAGADAIIVQDLAVVRLARALCPDLAVHASTQMTLTSAESIRLLEELGVERVVVARELSLRDLRRIRRRTRMPLEVFVHGALCVAYSGQCLTSEALGGRSANRGQCAQACRLPYQVVSDGREIPLGDVQYLLSPQDLAAWRLIPQLIELGVAGLKIEGRLKSPEYVANITRHYRLAVDAAVAGRPVEFTKREIQDMEMSFSRGFSHGWLDGDNHKLLVQGRCPKKRGVFLGEVLSVARGRVGLSLNAPIKRGDGVVFDQGRPAEDEPGGRVYEVFRGRESLRESVSAGVVELAFGHDDVDLTRIRPGDRLWKTDDPELNRRLRQSFTAADPQRRVPLDVDVTASVGQPLRVAARAANGGMAAIETPEPLAAALKHPLTPDVLRAQLGRLGGSVYELRDLAAHVDGSPMVPLSVLGALRRRLIDELDRSLDRKPQRVIAADSPLAALRAEIAAGVPRVPRLDDRVRRLDDRVPRLDDRVPRLDDRVPRLCQPCGVGVASTTVDISLAAGAAEQTASRSVLESQHRTADTPVAPGGIVAPGETVAPGVRPASRLRVLCRSFDQLDAALDAGVGSLYADFQDIRDYAEVVRRVHAVSAEVFLATPRIQKPAEGPIFRYLLRSRPDGILARNLGGLLYFAQREVPVVGDFSLNAANELTVQLYRHRGAARVTASFDLNREQLTDLVAAVPPGWLEVVLHQHMPMFHMEHCVFCAVLSPGTDRTNCGRPCDRHEVQLRDRAGMLHPLKADVGCRNTLYNAVPQSAAETVPALVARGVRDFRVELLNEPPAEVARIVALYRDLLAGRVTGRMVWTALQAANRVGVTRGPLET